MPTPYGIACFYRPDCICSLPPQCFHSADWMIVDHKESTNHIQEEREHRLMKAMRTRNGYLPKPRTRSLLNYQLVKGKDACKYSHWSGRGKHLLQPRSFVLPREEDKKVGPFPGIFFLPPISNLQGSENHDKSPKKRNQRKALNLG